MGSWRAWINELHLQSTTNCAD